MNNPEYFDPCQISGFTGCRSMKVIMHSSCTLYSQEGQQLPQTGARSKSWFLEQGSRLLRYAKKVCKPSGINLNILLRISYC